VQLGQRQIERLRDLLLGPRPAEAAFELAVGLLEHARLLAHAPRHPVHPAQTVEDRAPDAELRIGRERRLLRRIEFLHGVEQPLDAPAHHLVELDLRRLPRGEPLHQPPHERQIGPHGLVGQRRPGGAERRLQARARPRPWRL